MSRRDDKRKIHDAAKRAGVEIEEVFPYLRALPDVAEIKGRRIYTVSQILEAIARAGQLKASAQCKTHPPGQACDLCALGQLRSS